MANSAQIWIARWGLLVTLLLVMGCLPLRPEEGRVERIWPPEGDRETGAADASPTARMRATSRDKATAPSSRKHTAESAGSLSADRSASAVVSDDPPDVAALHDVSDPRLNSQQQQQLHAQLSSMMLPFGYSNTSPAIVRSNAAEPTSDVNLASFISDSPNAQPAEPPQMNAADSRAKDVADAAKDEARDEATKANGSSAAPTTNSSVEVAAEPDTTDPKPSGADNSASAKPADVSEPTVKASGPPAVSSPGASEISPQNETVIPDEQTTERNWRDDLQHAIVGLEQQLEVKTLSADERTRLEAKLRLLYVADDRRDEAAKPINSLDDNQQEFWKFSLTGFLELLNADGPPIDGRRAKLALRHFREAVYHLGAASSLDVRNLAICRRVESFGSYTEFESYEFRPEQEVILYVEVGNFAVEQKDDGYETELQGSYQILDQTGRRIADYDLMLDKQMCRSIRTDYFFPYVISLPKDLSAGSYRIQVTIEDKKGRKFGQTPPVEFSIR